MGEAAAVGLSLAPHGALAGRRQTYLVCRLLFVVDMQPQIDMLSL